jgi:hypothetical protein
MLASGSDSADVELRVAVISASMGNSQASVSNDNETALLLALPTEHCHHGWIGSVNKEREENTVSFIRRKAAYTGLGKLYNN